MEVAPKGSSSPTVEPELLLLLEVECEEAALLADMPGAKEVAVKTEEAVEEVEAEVALEREVAASMGEEFGVCGEQF